MAIVSGNERNISGEGGGHFHWGQVKKKKKKEKENVSIKSMNALSQSAQKANSIENN